MITPGATYILFNGQTAVAIEPYVLDGVRCMRMVTEAGRLIGVMELTGERLDYDPSFDVLIRIC